MPEDFIPKNHDEFVAKLTQFAAWLNTNGAAFGFTAAEIAVITSAKGDVIAKLATKRTADTAALAANEDLLLSEKNVTVPWRADARRLQPHPNMTDTIREQAGITVPDRIRTPKVVGPEVPGVEAELTTGGVFIHWGTNPTNEALNAKPPWAIGANIYLSINGGPEFLAGFDSSSPYFHGVTGAPISLTIRVAYRGPKENQIGIKSAPVTVSTGG